MRRSKFPQSHGHDLIPSRLPSASISSSFALYLLKAVMASKTLSIVPLNHYLGCAPPIGSVVAIKATKGYNLSHSLDDVVTNHSARASTSS